MKEPVVTYQPVRFGLSKAQRKEAKRRANDRAMLAAGLRPPTRNAPPPPASITLATVIRPAPQAPRDWPELAEFEAAVDSMLDAKDLSGFDKLCRTYADAFLGRKSRRGDRQGASSPAKPRVLEDWEC